MNSIDLIVPRLSILMNMDLIQRTWSRKPFLLGITLAVCVLCSTVIGCSRCPDITYHYDKKFPEAVQVLEKNVEFIPPHSLRYFEKKIRINANNKFNEWSCRIRLDYSGGGGFLWFVQDRFERNILVRLEKQDSGTLISTKDYISQNAIYLNRVGENFADQMIPFILSDYSGNVELKYNDESLYSKGEVVKGTKEGEWKWWYPNGEVMQIANYKHGKYDGERKIREKVDGRYLFLVFHYSNGVLHSQKPVVVDQAAH